MNPSPPPPQPLPTSQIAALRTALRDAQAAHANAPLDDAVGGAAHRRRLKAVSQAVDEAAAPLTAAFALPLLRYCGRLARQPGPNEPFEADDLAQDAWANALEYLRNPIKGDRIQSDVHFGRLLRQCALHLFLDRRKQKGAAQTLLDAPAERWGGETPAEQLVAPPVLPDVLQNATQSRWVEWLHALFAGDAAAFRAACRIPPRRRIVVYQAFVLLSLAGFLRVLQAQTGRRGQWGGSLLRELASHMNLPPPFWDIVEQAVRAAPPMTEQEMDKNSRDAGISDEIKTAICAACGVPVMSRTLFHVVRSEVSKLAMGESAQSQQAGKTQEGTPE